MGQTYADPVKRPKDLGGEDERQQIKTLFRKILEE